MLVELDKYCIRSQDPNNSSDTERGPCLHQTEPTAYMFGNSIAAKYLPGGELITMLGFSFSHYRYNFLEASYLTIIHLRFGESGEQELVESKDDLPATEVG